MTGFTFRKSVRRALKISVFLSTEAGEHIIKTHTLDVSVEGAKLRLDNAVSLPKRFNLAFSNDGRVRRVCRVVWRSTNAIGVEFMTMRRGAAI